jgi:hypothetical protein
VVDIVDSLIGGTRLLDFGENLWDSIGVEINSSHDC